MYYIRRDRRPRRSVGIKLYIGEIQKPKFYFLDLMLNDNIIGLGPPRTSVPTVSYYNSYIITINSRPIIKLFHNKIKGAETRLPWFSFCI